MHQNTLLMPKRIQSTQRFNMVVTMFVKMVNFTVQKYFQLTVEANIMQMVQFGCEWQTAWHGMQRLTKVFGVKSFLV